MRLPTRQRREPPTEAELLRRRIARTLLAGLRVMIVADSVLTGKPLTSPLDKLPIRARLRAGEARQLAYYVDTHANWLLGIPGPVANDRGFPLLDELQSLDDPYLLELAKAHGYRMVRQAEAKLRMQTGTGKDVRSADLYALAGDIAVEAVRTLRAAEYPGWNLTMTPSL